MSFYNNQTASYNSYVPTPQAAQYQQSGQYAQPAPQNQLAQQQYHPAQNQQQMQYPPQALPSNQQSMQYYMAPPSHPPHYSQAWPVNQAQMQFSQQPQMQYPPQMQCPPQPQMQCPPQMHYQPQTQTHYPPQPQPSHVPPQYTQPAPSHPSQYPPAPQAAQTVNDANQSVEPAEVKQMGDVVIAEMKKTKSVPVGDEYCEWITGTDGEPVMRCWLCDVICNSGIMQASHCQGKKHKKNKAEVRGMPIDKLRAKIAKTAKPLPKNVGRCKLCDVDFPTEAQRKSHMNGKKHKENVRLRDEGREHEIQKHKRKKGFYTSYDRLPASTQQNYELSRRAKSKTPRSVQPCLDDPYVVQRNGVRGCVLCDVTFNSAVMEASHIGGKWHKFAANAWKGHPEMNPQCKPLTDQLTTMPVGYFDSLNKLRPEIQENVERGLRATANTSRVCTSVPQQQQHAAHTQEEKEAAHGTEADHLITATETAPPVQGDLISANQLPWDDIDSVTIVELFKKAAKNYVKQQPHKPTRYDNGNAPSNGSQTKRQSPPPPPPPQPVPHAHQNQGYQQQTQAPMQYRSQAGRRGRYAPQQMQRTSPAFNTASQAAPRHGANKEQLSTQLPPPSRRASFAAITKR